MALILSLVKSARCFDGMFPKTYMGSTQSGDTVVTCGIDNGWDGTCSAGYTTDSTLTGSSKQRPFMHRYVWGSACAEYFYYFTSDDHDRVSAMDYYSGWNYIVLDGLYPIIGRVQPLTGRVFGGYYHFWYKPTESQTDVTLQNNSLMIHDGKLFFTGQMKTGSLNQLVIYSFNYTQSVSWDEGLETQWVAKTQQSDTTKAFAPALAGNNINLFLGGMFQESATDSFVIGVMCFNAEDGTQRWFLSLQTTAVSFSEFEYIKLLIRYSDGDDENDNDYLYGLTFWEYATLSTGTPMSIIRMKLDELDNSVMPDPTTDIDVYQITTDDGIFKPAGLSRPYDDDIIYAFLEEITASGSRGWFMIFDFVSQEALLEIVADTQSDFSINYAMIKNVHTLFWGGTKKEIHYASGTQTLSYKAGYVMQHRRDNIPDHIEYNTCLTENTVTSSPQTITATQVVTLWESTRTHNTELSTDILEKFGITQGGSWSYKDDSWCQPDYTFLTHGDLTIDTWEVEADDPAIYIPFIDPTYAEQSLCDDWVIFPYLHRRAGNKWSRNSMNMDVANKQLVGETTIHDCDKWLDGASIVNIEYVLPNCQRSHTGWHTYTCNSFCIPNVMTLTYDLEDIYYFNTHWAITYILPEWEIDIPNCEFTSITLTQSNGEDLTGSMYLDWETRNFTVYSQDSVHVGEYTIRYQANFWSTNTFFDFKVHILAPCVLGKTVLPRFDTIVYKRNYSPIVVEWTHFYNDPQCLYTWAPSQAFLYDHNAIEEERYLELPDVFVFDEENYTNITIFGEDIELGHYTIVVNSTLNDATQTTARFYLEIEVVRTGYDEFVPTKSAPQLPYLDQNITIVFGKEGHYNIGRGFDAEKDDFEVKCDFGPEIWFAYCDFERMKLIITNETTYDDLGKYSMNVTIFENSTYEEKFTEYQVNITVVLPSYYRPPVFNNTEEEWIPKWQPELVGTKPTVQVNYLTELGLLSLLFNTRIKLPDNFEEVLQEAISLKIIPSEISEMEYLQFTAELILFTETEIEIQLYFKTAPYVSHNRDFPDLLEISFYNSTYFMAPADVANRDARVRLLQDVDDQELALHELDDEEELDRYADYFFYLEPVKISHVLPAQIQLGTVSGILEAVGDALRSAANVVVAGKIVSSLIFSVSEYALLWGIINSLQIITTIPLAQVNLPGNINMLFNMMNDVANFEIIPSDEVLENMFSFSETYAYLPNFSVTNYKTSTFLLNVGFQFLVFLAIGLYGKLMLAIKKATRRTSERCTLCVNKYYNKVFYNMIIRFTLEGFIEILFSCLINFSDMQWETAGDALSALLSIGSLIFCLAMFAYSPYFLHKNRDELDLPKIKHQHLALYAGVKEKSLYKKLYNVQFMLRRILHVLTLMYIYQQAYFQAVLIQLINLIPQAFMFIQMPMQDDKVNNLEILNEFVIACICFLLPYFYMSFDAQQRYNVGWGVCGTVVLITVINFMTVIITTMKNYYYHLRRAIHKRKVLKAFQKRLDQNIEYQKQKTIGKSHQKVSKATNLAVIAEIDEDEEDKEDDSYDGQRNKPQQQLQSLDNFSSHDSFMSSRERNQTKNNESKTGMTPLKRGMVSFKLPSTEQSPVHAKLTFDLTETLPLPQGQTHYGNLLGSNHKTGILRKAAGSFKMRSPTNNISIIDNSQTTSPNMQQADSSRPLFKKMQTIKEQLDNIDEIGFEYGVNKRARPQRELDPAYLDPNNEKDRELIPDAESSLTDEIGDEDNDSENQKQQQMVRAVTKKSLYKKMANITKQERFIRSKTIIGSKKDSSLSRPTSKTTKMTSQSKFNNNFL